VSRSTPAARIDAGVVVLRRHQPADVPALVVAVNQSLAHLAPWMVWAQAPASEVAMAEFVAGAVRDFDQGSDFGYLIVENGPLGERVVGACGLHRRLGPGAIEIGYWVHVDHVRRGIARCAAVALREQAFGMGLERVEIHCDERNRASAAVARSAGFTFVGSQPRPPVLPTQSDRELVFRAAPAV
jgi:RimJ/RimL family protein N-acetyltransferase